MSSRAQIVATIGPASSEVALLEDMVRAGLDVGRLNFSHGTHEGNGTYIDALREAAARAGKRVPIILDLSGPRDQEADGHHFDTEKAAINEKDVADLEFGITKQVEYIAQSYVGSRADIDALRALITEREVHLPIIAKIERREAVDHLAEIVEAADALMVARGDLGLAVPIEEIPFIERAIIEAGKRAGKPVITATQMLYTMKDNPTPTRAEVTDVEYAIILGSDAVMLSEETALGKYPLETIEAMEKMIARVERDESIAINAL